MERAISMDPQEPPPDRLRFGPFEIDVRRAVLWRDDEVVAIQKLPARVLIRLASAEGNVVTRVELLESFWGGRRIGFDDRLNTCIAEIRRALRDSASSPGFVETIRGRGYRMRCPVARVSPRSIAENRPWRSRRVVRRWRVVWAVAASLALVTLAPRPRAPAVDPPYGEAWLETSNELARNRYLRAISLTRSGRISDLRLAAQLLSQSLQEDPNFGAAHSASAVVSALLAMEASEPYHLTGARDHRASAAGIRPASLHVRNAERAIALAEGDTRQVEGLGDSSVAANATDPTSRLLRGLTLRRAGFWDASSAELTEWTSAAPRDSRPWAELAINQVWLGLFDEADVSYEMAIAFSPKRPELYLRRARLALRSGKGSNEAIRIIESGEPHTGMSAEYLIHMDPLLARELGPRLDWRRADGTRFERAYDRGVFYLSRGLIEEVARDTTRAKEAFRLAISELRPIAMNPDSWSGTPDYHGFLGLAYAGIGELGRAGTVAEEILRRYPPKPDNLLSAYMRSLAAEIQSRLGLGARPLI